MVVVIQAVAVVIHAVAVVIHAVVVVIHAVVVVVVGHLQELSLPILRPLLPPGLVALGRRRKLDLPG